MPIILPWHGDAFAAAWLGFAMHNPAKRERSYVQFDTSKPGGYFAPIGDRNFGVESVVRRHYPHDDIAT